MQNNTLFYKRVLIKLSGESFCETGGQGISPTITANIAKILKEVAELNVQLAVVVGGGNMIRGATLSQHGMNRDTADYMGMLGTLINALALQTALEELGVQTRVQSAIATHQVAEPYIRRRAIRHLEKGRVVILAGGAGIPRFTTDTVSILRAKELGMEVVLKATKVDGVYTSDPLINVNAQRYRNLSFRDAIEKKLAVMDATAFTLAEEHQMAIVVFDLKKHDNLLLLIKGNDIGTRIDNFIKSTLA